MAQRPSTSSMSIRLDHEEAAPRRSAGTAVPRARGSPRSSKPSPSASPPFSPVIEDQPRRTPRISRDDIYEPIKPTAKAPAPAPAAAQHRPFWKDKGSDEVEKAFDTLLAEEHGFVKGIQDYLTLHERTKARDSLQLLQAYDEAVFSAIQGDIDAELAKRSTKSLQMRRQKSMDEFLLASNSKATGLFRDIILPDYDPQKDYKHIIRFRSRVEADPCKLELRNSLPPALQPGARPKKKEKTGIGGPRLSVELWDKLDITPYGRMGQPSAQYVNPQWKINNKVMHDQFQFPTDNAAALREQPKGKRCFHPPSRSPLTFEMNR